MGLILSRNTQTTISAFCKTICVTLTVQFQGFKPRLKTFLRVCRYLMYGSGLFPADARRFRPATAARRGAEGQIQTLPLQRLRRGVCVLDLFTQMLR